VWRVEEDAIVIAEGAFQDMGREWHRKFRTSIAVRRKSLRTRWLRRITNHADGLPAESRVLMLNIRERRGLVCSGFRVRDETVAAPFRGTGVPFCAHQCLFLL
jgi:hypothetical protein